MKAIYTCLATLVLLGIAANSEGQPSASQKGSAPDATWIRRLGQIARVKNDQLEEFKKLVNQPPKDLAALLTANNVRGQSVFAKEIAPGSHYAFRFVEYTGDQLATDLHRLAGSPGHQEWAKAIDGCLQSPWADVEEVFYWAGRSDIEVPADRVQVYGQVVGLRPEMADAYRLLHAHAWPGVLAKITEGNIRNYAIYWATIDSKMYLFAYFEYVGTDFASDMAAVDGDPATQAWMKFTDKACQLPIPTRKAGEWWANMDNLLTSRPAD